MLACVFGRWSKPRLRMNVSEDMKWSLNRHDVARELSVLRVKDSLEPALTPYEGPPAYLQRDANLVVDGSQTLR
jgi:hypothetical protein